MWNTSFSEVVIVYKYLFPPRVVYEPPIQFPYTLTTLFFTHNNTALTSPDRPETRMSVAFRLSPWSFYRSRFPSPIWLVCLFCLMSSRKVNHELRIMNIQSSYGFATLLFCITGSSELCQSVPICPQSCGETLSHPAPCSMHVFVSKLLWALARVHNVIEGLRLQNIGYNAD